MPKKKKPVKTPKKNKTTLSKKFVNTIKSRNKRLEDMMKEMGL